MAGGADEKSRPKTEQYQEEPERGSFEHATLTTLQTYRHDLNKITDPPVRENTVNTMVQRMRDYDKQHKAIASELGPRIRELEAKHDPLPENDPQRGRLKKQLVAVDREWDRRLTPLSKALHKDLDSIVKVAISPYRDRDRAFLKSVKTVGSNLRSRELAEAFKARQQQQRASKDRDHER